MKTFPGFTAPLNVACDKQLAIVDIGVDKDAPHGCLHIFPAVLSLARNTQGFTRWARMAIDKNAETAEIAREFGVDREADRRAHGEVDEDLYFSGCAHGERV